MRYCVHLCAFLLRVSLCTRKYVSVVFFDFLQGHGGNGFLKFQDSEEITNIELADAFEQMWQKRR